PPSLLFPYTTLFRSYIGISLETYPHQCRVSARIRQVDVSARSEQGFNCRRLLVVASDNQGGITLGILDIDIRTSCDQVLEPGYRSEEHTSELQSREN